MLPICVCALLDTESVMCIRQRRNEVKMAKKDYTQLAKDIVAAVGGKDNVSSVSNCMTRLRFILRNEKKADDAAVKAISGVSGVMYQGGQYQVIIGTHVTNVLPFVKKELNLEAVAVDNSSNTMEIGKEKAESMRLVKKDSVINRFFKVIQGCLMPLIGVMCGAGILKGILAILATAGILQSTDGTYVLLYNAADAVMIFLPILVGYSAAKVFDATPMLMMTVSAVLVSPALLTYVGAEQALTFLRIPVSMIDYKSSFFPAIAAVWLASKIEKLSKKLLPEMLHLMFVPLIVIVVSVPVTLIVIGPVITSASNIVANGVVALVNLSPLVAGIVVGALWQLVVLTGLHGAMIPILINNITMLGEDPLNSILTMTVFAVTGVAFGYALKISSKERKAAAFGNVISGLFGITEPIIYTIALPKFKNFVCAFVGGGIAGGIIGLFNVKFYNFAGNGIFALPGMIKNNVVDKNFYIACIAAVVAFVISAICAFIVNSEDD